MRRNVREHERDEMKRQLETLMKQQSLTEMTKTARTMLADKEINVSDDLLIYACIRGRG
ncbi:capsid assembly scaffolding protein Gp46 family protein [Blautia producta]|uniref:capsid assembly scaffolding protein Gp46 family protein n=1 Tax=Blautia producta TaxID=33035 RepID=UPI002D7FF824|nr:DUF4355 domain-containing protein [Blautia producta]